MRAFLIAAAVALTLPFTADAQVVFKAPAESAVGKRLTVFLEESKGQDLKLKVLFNGKELTAEKAPLVLKTLDDKIVMILDPEDAGTYTFVGAVNADNKTHLTLHPVSVKGPVAKPPVKPTDPVKPPKDPAVPPSSKLYFLIVRPDGPAQPDFTAVMALPEWASLTKAGHTYKDKTVSEAGTLGVVIPNGTTLPSVLVLKTSADGKNSEVVKTVPFPRTASDITNLPK